MYTKLIKTFLLSCLLAFCQAEETISLAAVTPYPLAEELKPDQPFEEGTKLATTPDAVYGPPPDVTDETNDSNVAIALAFDGDVPTDQDTDIIEPDSLNPETTIDSDAEEAIAEAEAEDVDTFMVRPEAERLIFRRRLLARPAKLRAAAQKATSIATIQKQAPSQAFFYIAQLQQF